MKLSTFMQKALNSFRNGKGFYRPASGNHGSKGRSLIEGLSYTQLVTGEKLFNKAQASIAKSLGHTNIFGFQDQPFSTVKNVVKAAIKRERANGN